MSVFYEPGHTLTHNALINMVIGQRGVGKTYALKNMAVQNWIKKQEKFIYLRRYQNELDLVKESLFADWNLNNEEPVVYNKAGYYTYCDNTIGYPFALTTSNSLKSASFPDVTLIIFDEFIIDTTNSYQRYLKKEVDLFLNFYETVARTRENVRAFLLANSLSFVNPYSIYWGLRNNGKQFVKSKNGLVLCEIYMNEGFMEFKNQTKFGQLIQGTQFGDMSVNNKFVLDDDTFICPRDPMSQYYVGIKINGNTYGIWCKERLFYVDKASDPSFPTFVFDVNSHDEKTWLGRRPKPLNPFFDAFKKGLVRFGDDFIKADCLLVLGANY